MDSMISIRQKNTLAEYMILSGADNRPPMLDKELYDSWKSIMKLYMQNREHKRMIPESVAHRPLIWLTIEENGVTKTKKYAELYATERIQADCDLKAINFILQCLPSDIYLLVNHHRVAKDLWERIQLLMQGTSLTKQERECKLYDSFDKFAHIKEESLHQYYLRFTQMINDMNIYKMKLEQFQVNTKFLNSLPPEWSKFVTDVKLVKDLHATNFDQIHAYLQQHELHANEIDSGLAVLVFKQGDDPIDVINKMMSFLVTVQPVQGRKTSFAAGMSGTRANISRTRRNNSGQQRFVKCFNCQGEGHMARQCLKPKRKRDATWFRDKVLLVEAQRNGKVLNEEELEFLVDPRVVEDLVTQTIITHNATYQADDLDAYDFECDDFSTAKAVLMANLSSYGLDVLSLVLHSENTHTDMLNQTVQDTNSPTRQDAMILFVFEQLSNQVTNYNKVNKDNLIANESLSAELEKYKEHVKLLEERQNVDLNNNLKQALGFQNPFYLKKAQQIRPMLYDGSVIAKETNVILIADFEETLMLEEVSRSKMLLKQSDLMVLEKKVNIKPINYAELNQLSKDFGKRFIPQQELSDEQALHPITDQSASSPV
ncbi:retrovirus-related pol polyprotein from transposon TNT 1-94 [Tanacetum coccineum]